MSEYFYTLGMLGWPEIISLLLLAIPVVRRRSLD